jgi:hypothetical protein
MNSRLSVVEITVLVGIVAVILFRCDSPVPKPAEQHPQVQSDAPVPAQKPAPPSIEPHDLDGAEATPAYNSQILNCANVGEFAEAVVAGKESGKSKHDAYSIINKTVPSGYINEEKTLKDIVIQIYTKDFAKKLSQSGARFAYEADCMAANSN